VTSDGPIRFFGGNDAENPIHFLIGIFLWSYSNSRRGESPNENINLAKYEDISPEWSSRPVEIKHIAKSIQLHFSGHSLGVRGLFNEMSRPSPILMVIPSFLF
jgi:hypothetical protein